MGMRTFPQSGLRANARARGRRWRPTASCPSSSSRLLDAHLARCGPCSRFAGQVAAVAAELRAAALQPLPRPVAIPTWRRRTVDARVRAVGAAAAVAVMALGIASRAPLSSGERQSLQVPPVLDFSGGDQAEQQQLRDLRREAIVAEIAARNRPARHFGNQPA